jgi:hypothetical protein
MSKQEAVEWVRGHGDDDQLDEDEIEDAFCAIFGRSADDDDRKEGLWNHLCAAVKQTD